MLSRTVLGSEFQTAGVVLAQANTTDSHMNYYKHWMYTCEICMRDDIVISISQRQRSVINLDLLVLAENQRFGGRVFSGSLVDASPSVRSSGRAPVQGV